MGNNADLFDYDETEWADTDDDGIGDNTDEDADGDGVPDDPVDGDDGGGGGGTQDDIVALHTASRSLSFRRILHKQTGWGRRMINLTDA